MDRAGLVGDDGPTHHGTVRYRLPALPAEHRADGAPRRGDARAQCCGPRSCTTKAGGAPPNPPWRRRRRGAPSSPHPLEIGTGEILREGDESPCSGTEPASARRSRPHRCSAERGISVTVADARFAKPIDAGLAAQLAAEHELLVTVEEGVLAGALAQRCGRRSPTPASRPGSCGSGSRSLRHPRRPGAPARGGRFHRCEDRRTIEGSGRGAERHRGL